MRETGCIFSSGDSLRQVESADEAALKFVNTALLELRDLEPTNADAIAHIANAERELRAAKRALSETV